LYGHWRTRFFSFLLTLEDKVSSNFDDIVLVRRDGFSLGISDDKNIIELKLCLMCIDDSSLIFVFPLHMLSVDNLIVKLFSDNN
jgi:hypothetical protein